MKSQMIRYACFVLLGLTLAVMATGCTGAPPTAVPPTLAPTALPSVVPSLAVMSLSATSQPATNTPTCTATPAQATATSTAARPTVTFSPTSRPTVTRVPSPTRIPSPTFIPTPLGFLNIPATPSSSQNRNNRLFDVAIIVEGQVANASSADIERVFNLANTELAKKTGQWMRLIEIVNSNVPAASSQQSEKIIQDYVARNAANPPEGIIVLSNDERCKAEGGYAYTLQPAYAFQNEFASPRDGVGDKKIYAAVLELEHPYSRCGYDVYGSGRVSTTSVGGECGNRTGLTCVQNGDLWVCPASLNDLYMNKDYYAASFIINGLLKNFDTEPEATEYRYGTPACTRRLGLGNFDLRISQMYFGVCPDLYARFRPKP